MEQFTGKTVVVTGGSRGIGRAIVEAFAKQGAQVVFTYGKSSTEAEAVVAAVTKAGGKAEAIQADARDPDALAKVFAGLGKRLKTIDVLVNNAGIYLNTSPDNPEGNSNFATTMAVNVSSVFSGTMALAPFIADKGGRIINIGSVMSEGAFFDGTAAYTASKHAVLGLTRAWVHDFSPRGITVNCIEPGPVDTEMNKDDGGEFSAQMKQMTPLKRYGKAEEIATLALYLASGQAAFVTGAHVNISGGWLS